MIIETYFLALVLMLLVSCIFWLISIAKEDVSIVDSLWPLFFIIASVFFYLHLETPSLRAQIITLLVLIWGIRLSTYITIRHWGHEEDHRYQKIRANNQPGFTYKSLYLIFGFQTVIAWFIALPLFTAINSTNSLGIIDWIGIALWLIGMFFEAVSDYQLWQFKRKPENHGKVMNAGLWRYTRHPNYFGEFLIWWGYFCFALAANTYWTVLSPLLMSFLLLKFSGVGLLEQTMKRRPGYEDYMKTTNTFFPGLANRKYKS